MKHLLSALLLAIVATNSVAQHAGHHGAGHGAAPNASPASPASPYAGHQQRSIKALSRQQMADLRAGKGMSLALPAELNGYPGPAHTLELAVPLELDAAQRERTSALFDEMSREAGALGERVIEAESALDRLFRERRATPENVARASDDAARLHGQLRATHLRYHLAMMEVLTPGQVARYSKLRGY